MVDVTGSESHIPSFALPSEAPTASATGLLQSFSRNLVNKKASWFEQPFGGTAEVLAKASWGWNFAQFAETKGNATAPGTSVHKGLQSGAFDALFYRNNPETPSSGRRGQGPGDGRYEHGFQGDAGCKISIWDNARCNSVRQQGLC